MACLAKSKLSSWQQGFSLVEILVALGVMTIIFGLATTTYTNFRSHNNLEIGVTSVAGALRYAKSNAEQGNGGSSWGVALLSDHLVIFKGDDYVGRDVGRDMPLELPRGVTISGLSEIVFQKNSGQTSDSGVIIISEGNSASHLFINEKGTVTY